LTPTPNIPLSRRSIYNFSRYARPLRSSLSTLATAQSGFNARGALFMAAGATVSDLLACFFFEFFFSSFSFLSSRLKKNHFRLLFFLHWFVIDDRVLLFLLFMNEHTIYFF
jgi:hypothetical protein